MEPSKRTKNIRLVTNEQEETVPDVQERKDAPAEGADPDQTTMDEQTGVAAEVTPSVQARRDAPAEGPATDEEPAFGDTPMTDEAEVVVKQSDEDEAPTSPRLRITLVKSGTGYKYDQKRTLLALGLRRLNTTIERPDNASVRGMLNKVQHLVRVEEIS